MKLVCNKSNPPLGGLITAHYIKLNLNKPVELTWGEDTVVEKVTCRTSNDVSRAIARLQCIDLYGKTALEMMEVDSWLNFAIGPLSSKDGFQKGLNVLNKALGPVTYLANKRITIADFAVFAVLYDSTQWKDILKSKSAPQNIQRWYNFMLSNEAVENALAICPEKVKPAQEKSGRAQEGKFVELPGAEMGKVVVRFPPEASGYLHIGHAKAALLNQYYQDAFKGKLIMRFDDTNPAKENLHFEKVILEDVAMLDIKPDMFTHTSQYFDLMLDYCEKMLKNGTAYVDDTEAELMKTQREQKIESANRTNSVEKNLQLWEEMKKGTPKGQTCCVRAKIDMQSANGCLRDPTIYRCKNEPHPRTGHKYKVYPTYDFACPIVDAIEGVTHTLRTMEYHDRDPQFYWFIDALGLRKPYIWEYSRLSMTNTVLSKRKLTWFVNEGLVDGWDDPRMPTVRGVIRRGMTVEGLKEFIIAQGSSRSVVFMEWDKIWAFNKKVIDPIAPRYSAVEYKNHAIITVNGVKTECLQAPKHPKNADIGTKDVWVSGEIVIDAADVELLEKGKNATFINWGNLLISEIGPNGIKAELNLANKDYKKTPKITWLAKTPNAKFTPTYCVYYDHLINKALLGKDEDFKTFIGHETRIEVEMLGDPELKKLKKGDIIQIQRKGFFIVDVAYQPANLNICVEQPIILFYIPDGSKENPMAKLQAPQKETSAPKEQKQKTSQATPVAPVATDEASLLTKISSQGEKIRDLKAKKAEKGVIDVEVKTLLNLKADYKTLTGKEWKPGAVAEKSTAVSAPAGDENTILVKIAAQGEKVRDLKAQKADKSVVEAEVKTLLALKAEYKTLTGKDWKPGAVAQTPAPVQNSAVSGNGDENAILEKIAAQGDKVRDIKAKKADKATVDAEVKTLLALKSEYKTITGKDWKPGAVAQKPAAVQSSALSGSSSENAILEKIAAQGDKVRDIKAKKADKATVDAEVKTLLALKSEYKTITGKDWKPGTVAPKSSSAPALGSNETTILEKIAVQGEKVRDLKAKKGDKSVVDAEVKTLLALKADYKTLNGKDWKPGTVLPIKETSVNQNNIMSGGGDNIKDALTAKITTQGNLVRDLKGKKANKDEIDTAVKVLLELKAEYKNVTGTDFPVAGRTPSKPKETKPNQQPKEKPAKQKAAPEKKPVNVDDSGVKKQTRLGLEAKKSENLSDWYSQVITKGEMIEYYDVSGCYILRPWSFAIWDAIREWFDGEIKKLGVQNCYFPIFVSKAVLEKEKDHIADFSPEVAWVTKSGDSDMAEPVAIRPTSETVMYPAYAKWIQSYRDLPIKLNQWNNVVRWEFKHPQPFLRTREFLWQEGHTAYASKEEAATEVVQILDLYAKIYTDLLAIPVIKGRKTEKEKFAGGDYTLTVEAFVSASGRGIQGATSHHLGQNFSRIFDIVYEDPETQEKKHIYQNSWGITTRTIGVMVMVHADDQGLVLPPRVASVQIAIVPCGITAGLSQDARDNLQKSCDELESSLKKVNIRVKGDYRDNYSPGWKFNHWELKGVPIRVELGPKDIEKNQLVAVRRDTGDKIVIPRATAVQQLSKLLDDIQSNLLKKATNDLNTHIVTLTEWSQFPSSLDKKNIILAPFCLEKECEEKIKADSTRDEDAEPGAPSMGAKSLCIPLEQPSPIKDTDKCIHPDCNRKPLAYTLFGRSY